MIRRARFLFCPAEPLPTHRADVRVLFDKCLPQQGVDVDVVGLADPASPEPARWSAGRAFLVRGGQGASGLLADLRQQLSLFVRARRGYDGLIVRDKPVLGIVGLLASRLAGIPYVYWISFPMPESYLRLVRTRGHELSTARRWFLKVRGLVGTWMLYRILLQRADWVFAQSDAMVAELQAKGVAHGRMSAVPMGVDLADMPPDAAPLPDRCRDRSLAVYLGTLDRYRDPQILADTARLVGQRVPDFMLLVIGEADEPADRGWLAAYAREIGAADWMHFTGRLPFRRGLELARNARVGLSPFLRNELLESASPTKAVEYLALGIPVVCNDQPDQKKVVGDSGGGWCVELTAEAFAAAILEALGDPDDARARAAAGRRYVEAHRDYPGLGRQVAQRLLALAHPRASRAGDATEVEPR